jgi:hypothetical protein
MKLTPCLLRNYTIAPPWESGTPAEASVPQRAT